MAPRCYALVSSCSRCRLAVPAHRQLSAAVPAAIAHVLPHDAGAAPGPSSQRRPYTSSSSLPLSASQRPASPFPLIDGQQRRRFNATALTSAKKKAKSKASSSSAAADDQAAASSRYPPLPLGWQAVIGVECHVQIKDKHKLFSSAPLPTPSSPLNSLVTPFDAAHPGTFPTLNRSALRLAARTALALNCKVHGESRFDRKHYFYSDLPAGYQITQKYAPLANNGSVKLSFHDGHLPSPEDEVTVEIEQLQLEQDTAKSSYFDTGTTSRLDASRQSPADAVPEATLHEADDERVQRSFVDLNRAGAGLMEIVSGPQMRTPEQAGAYVRKLQELVRRVGASDGNMQEGSLRCDVNVSVNRVGEPFGTRCEVKNLNSARFMMNAISHEAHRQVQLLEQPGGRIEQETRGYNESNGTTFRLRGKEDAPDYRYMPDPNLPPVLLSEMQIQELRNGLPELPDAKRARLSKQYGLASRDINVLMRVGSEDDRDGRVVASIGEDGQASSDAVEYFERVAEGRNAQTALNWIIHELMKGLNARNLPFRQWYLPAHYLGQLIDLVEAGQVTGTTAKAVIADVLSSASASSASVISLAELDRLAQTSTTPVFDLLQKQELLALATTQDLLPLVESAFRRLPDEVAQVRKGNLKVAMRIVGQVMKDANGRADAKLVHTTILQQLAQPPSSS
ncbi:glutamyl-tRNA amidotransferase [Moesziomyces antarcticus]|uniref:Glutamyl-tRNA(Gln) amidotransferase subunit B, mitochondrial n=2 Tax=Pseudozyma antarctica TaxID=84753 RepID=A0A081CJ46_PSEA2|nr:glutamyl-tRNA amidotransferase [Moesziomyces antarcticus]GAK66692.1 glutamyl-tRNA amidotransferase [Moesziomyces antarcticus]SPO47740.1 related to PET112 - putative glutamyl-tRNA(Gln)amidotransferase subunit B, mitochondrial precursor [Moesziomyces antarcticus]